MTSAQIESVDSLTRVRRAMRRGGSEVRADLQPVIDRLEAAAGGTVSRSASARLLGISQTALDRWVEAGEIASVITRAGRRAVPVRQLVDLLEAVNQARELGSQRPVARVIHQRRAAADQLDVGQLLPHAETSIHGHRSADLRSLAYHRVVAQRLDPALVADARARFRRWREAGTIDPHWAARWEQMLEQPLDEIARAISGDDDEGQELRQNSPFAGVLNEQERRRVLEVASSRDPSNA